MAGQSRFSYLVFPLHVVGATNRLVQSKMEKLSIYMSYLEKSGMDNSCHVGYRGNHVGFIVSLEQLH